MDGTNKHSNLSTCSLPSYSLVRIADAHKDKYLQTEMLITSSQVQTHHTLTRRELEIAQCLLAGMRTKATARELFISPRTVETHLENIKIKLNCRNKFELAIKLSKLLYAN